MINYKNHYKERKPEETIKIIENFFLNLNMKIKRNEVMISEINTYSIQIILFDKNDFLILYANGKGETEEFAIASAYGELYERFCNMRFIMKDGIAQNLFLQKRKQKYNYYYHPEEKEFSLIELINADQNFHNFFLGDFSEKDSDIINFYNTLFNNKFIAAPYQDLLDSNKQYFYNPYLMTVLRGSGGMAAGNTLEEALNQGISELYEHYITDKFRYLKKDFDFHFIDISTIKNQKLKEKIKLLTDNENYEYYLIDFSYNFNVPVLLSILIDKTLQRFFINFGSFPIFDIALERTLTELYQGVVSFKEEEQSNNIIVPYKSGVTIIEALDATANVTNSLCLNESFLLSEKKFYSPNSKIFLFNQDKNYSNEDILNYYKKLSSYLNINFCYLDVSQSSEMHAIQIYSINLPHFSLPLEAKKMLYKKQQLNVYKLLSYFIQLENKWLNNHIWDNLLWEKIIILYNQFTIEDILLFNISASIFCFNFSKTNNLLSLIEQFIKMDSNIYMIEEQIIAMSNKSILSEDIKKFLTQYRYIVNNDYLPSEKTKILKTLIPEFSQDETLFKNIITPEYFLQVIMEKLYEYYHSEKYSDYLDALVG
ncbi:MAG: hypothetical protein E7167_02240 [Firmicutes bacterium]|nr:hypothetical protein [Bacillota bacterium]